MFGKTFLVDINNDDSIINTLFKGKINSQIVSQIFQMVDKLPAKNTAGVQ